MAERIYRSRLDRKLAGVCGGIAEYFDIDPSLVRIVFVLLAFFNGFGVLAYLICWIVLPEQPLSAPMTEPQMPTSIESDTHSQSAGSVPSAKRRWATGLGILLIAVGFAMLLERLIPWLDFGDLVPYLLIVAGILLLYRGWSEQKRTPETVSHGQDQLDAT